MRAAQYGHRGTAELLLRRGADPAIRATVGKVKGKTALDIAEKCSGLS